MQDFIAFLIGLIFWGISLVVGGSAITYEPAPPAQEAVQDVVENVDQPPALSTAPAPALLPKTTETPKTKTATQITLLPSLPPSHPDYISTLEEEVLVQTNVERVKQGLAPLRFDSALVPIARMHSADMEERDYFSHSDPDDCNSACRAKKADYQYRALGENLFLMQGFDLSARDAAALIVQGWMGSPGHRANILRDYYTHTGIGVVVGASRIYITALYSLPR